MFDAEAEIELFESDDEKQNHDLIDEDWGSSWQPDNVMDNANHQVASCDNVGEVVPSPSASNAPIERMLLNDHKAGMQDLDKEKINRIIHEASKGSKFYENEKRKERQTKVKINNLKIELTKVTDADRKRAITESNKILKNLRKSFDLSRTMVHVDMDAFYAAVEIRDNPKLKDLPMAVGSNSMLSTSNYVARRFGVRAAMPGFIAKKLCPHLVIIPLHFEKYKTVSCEIREIFHQYDPNFAPMSLDEAFLDLTDYINENAHKYKETGDEVAKDAVEIIVEEIRLRIFQKTQLTASAGIASNMMLSKICSDMNKPNGQYYLKPDLNVIEEFILQLPIRKVFGIGKVSEQMLKALDIFNCKDLLDKRDIIFLLFSETSFKYFMRVALGISGNRITHDERKSMSVERTFHDTSDKDELFKICYDICESLSNDLLTNKLQGKNITLKYKLASFVSRTRSKTISYPVSKTNDIYSIVKEMLVHEIKRCRDSKFELRLMGVRVCQFIDNNMVKQNTVEQFFKEKTRGDHDGGNSKTDDDVGNNIKVDSSNVEVISPKKNPPRFEELNESGCSKDNLVHCPVCGIAQKSDPVHLNTHIDNCLTRKTIKEIVKEQDEVTNSTSVIPSKTCLNSGKRKSQKRKSCNQINSPNKKATLFTFWKKT